VFERVTICVSDGAASEAFYRIVLPTLGVEAGRMDFALGQARPPEPPTTRLHLAFRARDHGDVERFWQAGVNAGYRDDGAPGPRPQYGPEYYGGFLLDPDGNSVEAVHNGRDGRPGRIDHLWIRVTDLAAAVPVYERVGGLAGFGVAWRHDGPRRVGFAGETGSFSLVEDGPPTRHARVAFPAAGEWSVRDPDGNELVLVRPWR
jgi:glyoxalase/bleomycin resistance protein/dioxygenase superfamily protein